MKFKHCCLRAESRRDDLGRLDASSRLFDLPRRARQNRVALGKHVFCQTSLKGGGIVVLTLAYSADFIERHGLKTGTVFSVEIPEVNHKGRMLIVGMGDATAPAEREGELLMAVEKDDDDSPGILVYGDGPLAEAFMARRRELSREIVLVMEKPDGSRSDITLIRPTDWLTSHRARLGGEIFLDLPEMDARGFARVIAINPCPPLELPGRGPHRSQLVMGTFRHESAEVYDLKLESESKPIGVTGSHPFWSVDRDGWVSVIDLEIEETLKTLAGTTIVESRTKRPGRETVYNVEVEGDHVYWVGESGVLVHNVSVPVGKDFGCDNSSGSGSNSCTSDKLWTSIGGKDPDWQPHHLIPCESRKKNYKVLEQAEKLGFDFNGKLNGLRLPSRDAEFAKQQNKPLHKGRPIKQYWACIKPYIDQLEKEYVVDKTLSDCEICPRLHKIAGKLSAALLAFDIWLSHNDKSIAPGADYKCP